LTGSGIGERVLQIDNGWGLCRIPSLLTNPYTVRFSFRAKHR
jgi:hypothetical protein